MKNWMFVVIGIIVLVVVYKWRQKQLSSELSDESKSSVLGGYPVTYCWDVGLNADECKEKCNEAGGSWEQTTDGHGKCTGYRGTLGSTRKIRTQSYSI